jgi:hypothetical protein
MFLSSDGKTVEVHDESEVRLFETPWWKLYWQRLDGTQMPAQFNWTAKGSPQYPRGAVVEERQKNPQ